MFFRRTQPEQNPRKVVIVGAGEVGYHVALRLTHEQKNVVVIDLNEQALQRMDDHMDVQTICGSGASPQVLCDLGLTNADVFLAVTNSDENNILACLFANTIAPKAQKLARIRNVEYLTHINILENPALNISALVNPEQEIVHSIDKRLTLPGAVEYGEFAKGRICMVAMKIHEGPLLGKELKYFRDIVKEEQIMVGAIVRHKSLIIPSGEDVLQEGDVVYFIYQPVAQAALLKALNRCRGFISSVCIVGGGRIGSCMAEAFARKGMAVTIIDRDAARCTELANSLENVTILHGDGTDKRLFEEEDLLHTDAFVALTSDENTNIVSCLLAKSLGMREAVSRVDKAEYLSLLENIGIDHSVSLRYSAVNSILQYVRQESVISCVSVGNEAAEIMEAKVRDNSTFIGCAVHSLGLPQGVLLLAIVREHEAYIPKGDTIIANGDRILLLALRDMVSKVEKILS